MGRALAEDRFGPLYLGSLIAYGDRFLIGPVLVAIALDFGVSLGAAAGVATIYLVAYGAAQPVYGVLSDRLGRVRVMRAALAGVAATNVLAALAPDLRLLVCARGLAGVFAAALLPTSLVYIGDRVPFGRRQYVVANVLAAGAVGTVLAAIGAGMLGSYASWRLVFLFPAGLAGVDAVLLRQLPESLPGEGTARPLAQLASVLRHPWAIFLFGLAIVEGAAILGFLTFMAPALQASGVSGSVAGLVIAVYGIAVFGGLQIVKRFLGRPRSSPVAAIAVGGAVLAAGYVVAAARQSVADIFVANVFIGIGFAFMHSTLQTWATEVAPEARGTATSLFVTFVYIGASIAHTAVSSMASGHRFSELFGIGAVISVPVLVVGSLARARFRTLADQP